MTPPTDRTHHLDASSNLWSVPDFSPEQLPQHIALVTDGNGRWAQQRGLPRTEGHREGERMLFELVKNCFELGIPYL
ncbi:MAG TPA: undecaprenyl diphosphate synthase family protein, partial [Mycobacteriales bacterium]|nr:undecaprenyl diphosphate synthase family protein [Mycobacteriales bacterium]